MKEKMLEYLRHREEKLDNEMRNEESERRFDAYYHRKNEVLRIIEFVELLKED